MAQTKIQSFVEALSNVAIGFSIALLTQIIVFPFFGIDIPLSKNIGITAVFTVVSIVRSYVVRRWFNRR